MRKILTLGILFFSLTGNVIHAQLKVGDNPNSIDPSAVLEMESSSKGLLLPRMTSSSRTAITSPANGLEVYDTDTKSIWYWNSTTWVEIKPGNSIDTTNDSWINNIASAAIQLGSTSTGSARAAGTGFIIKDNGNVGIGTTSPDTSSLLDISSTNKGFLAPRINLTSNTMDLDGISGQATGLLVFNTGTTLPAGFYYWNGTEWRNVVNASAKIPLIAILNCSSATLFPKSYTAGIAYTGTMTIPYTDGNGGVYPAGTPIASTGVTGLTATLQSGTLNNGPGTLVYTVTGTPSLSSPSTASFTLPTTMGATGCIATVGIGNQFAIGEVQSTKITVPASTFFANGASNLKMNGKNATNTTNVNTQSAYDVAADSVKEKFIVINNLRLDFMESGTNNNVRPEFYNTSTVSIPYDISSISSGNSYTDGAGTTLASHAYSLKVDGNDDFAMSNGGDAEYVNCMLSFQTGEWYNLTFYATRDATYVYLYITAQRLN